MGMMRTSGRVKPLATIDFPLGLTGTDGLPQTRRALKNCFNVGGRILQRLGITQLGTNSRVARGAFEWNGALYVVASQDLLKVATDGSYSIIGTIEGTAPIDSAPGFNEIAIVVRDSSGKGYGLDKSDTLTENASPQFVASNSVTHINGRHVYVPFNGDPVIFSDVGAARTIQTTSFIDAEELPDLNKVNINFRNTLGIGGTDSFEFFRDFGNPTVPFRRTNARIDYGYIGGILEYLETFFFIGREKGQDLGIFAYDGNGATKISNEFIDTILSTYTEDELSDCISNRVKFNTHDVATFTLANHAFGYFNGQWFELDTQINGENANWQGGYIVEHKLDYYSFVSDKIGVFAKVNKDYGNPFERLIDFGIEQEGDFAIGRIQYNLSQGYNENVGSVALQMSDDNVLYTQPFHVNTGAIGNYQTELSWDFPGGLGSYQDFAGIRLSTAEDIDFSARSVYAE